MKLSRDKLKQIIKEELTKMMEESGEPQVVSQQQDKVRLVKLSVGGKQVEISFSSSGGSPLVSKSFYDELSDAEQSEVMQKAQAAAGIKGMEDYSEDEMQRMMGGEEISGFKPMKEEEVNEARYDAMIGWSGGGTDERPSRGDNTAARFADLEDRLDALRAKLKKAEGSEKETIQKQIEKVKQQMRDLD